MDIERLIREEIVAFVAGEVTDARVAGIVRESRTGRSWAWRIYRRLVGGIL